MNQLYDLNPVDVPKTLLTSEINQLKQQTIQQFGGGQKIDMDMLPDDMFQDRAQKGSFGYNCLRVGKARKYQC